MARRTSWAVWGLAVVLALLALAGGGVLYFWQRSENDRAIVIHSGTVSPDGRWVLVQLAQPGDELRTDIPHAVVNWKRGETESWRRIPEGAWPVWNPRGDLLARYEPLHFADVLVCRRVPELTEVWRLSPYPGGAVWTPDGEQLVTRVGVRTAKAWDRTAEAWDLVSVSRSGVRRLILDRCSWLPLQVIRDGSDLAIVCFARGQEPKQLALLRMDGTLIRRFGPKFGWGAYVVGKRGDRFGWRGYKNKGCFLAFEEHGTWKSIRLSFPPIPQDSRSVLMWSGDEHLMAMQTYGEFPFWSVGWSGRVRKLQRPGGEGTIPEPWIDGRHLIQDSDHRLELIDGYTGQIVRQVPVRLPGLNF